MAAEHEVTLKTLHNEINRLQTDIKTEPDFPEGKRTTINRTLARFKGITTNLVKLFSRHVKEQVTEAREEERKKAQQTMDELHEQHAREKRELEERLKREHAAELKIKTTLVDVERAAIETHARKDAETALKKEKAAHAITAEIAKQNIKDLLDEQKAHAEARKNHEQIQADLKLANADILHEQTAHSNTLSLFRNALGAQFNPSETPQQNAERIRELLDEAIKPANKSRVPPASVALPWYRRARNWVLGAGTGASLLYTGYKMGQNVPQTPPGIINPKSGVSGSPSPDYTRQPLPTSVKGKRTPAPDIEPTATRSPQTAQTARPTTAPDVRTPQTWQTAQTQRPAANDLFIQEPLRVVENGPKSVFNVTDKNTGINHAVVLAAMAEVESERNRGFQIGDLRLTMRHKHLNLLAAKEKGVKEGKIIWVNPQRTEAHVYNNLKYALQRLGYKGGTLEKVMKNYAQRMREMPEEQGGWKERKPLGSMNLGPKLSGGFARTFMRTLLRKKA